MANCTFSPPVDQGLSYVVDYFGNTPTDADPLAIRLMSHFAQGRRASNVYVMQDGTVTTSQPPNWNPGQPNAPYAEVWNYAGSTTGVQQYQAFTHPPNLIVRHVYWGGHTNPVHPEDEPLLVAAGYGPYINCVDSPPPVTHPNSNFPFPGQFVLPDEALFPHGTVTHPTAQTWTSVAGQWTQQTAQWAGE